MLDNKVFLRDPLEANKKINSPKQISRIKICIRIFVAMALCLLLLIFYVRAFLSFLPDVGAGIAFLTLISIFLFFPVVDIILIIFGVDISDFGRPSSL